MGYLQLDSGIPNFSKAVFSLFFRIPQASIDAAVAQFNSVDIGADGGAFSTNLLGILPLVVFGPNPTASVSSADFSASTVLSPSFIGVNCGQRLVTDHSDPVEPPFLSAHLAYSGQDDAFTLNEGTITESHWVRPNHFQIGYGAQSIWGVSPSNTYAVVNGLALNSRINISADTLHHLLISVDLGHSPGGTIDGSGYVTFSDPCKFWLAFDDANYDGTYLWPACAAMMGPGAGPNDIISCSGFDGSTKPNGALQSNGLPFGVPCTSENVAWVYDGIMAELQIFTGVTLDTSVEENRRAFITANGTPEKSSVAQALLGKRPDVLFHGSDNFKNGTNTGTRGDFTPTGTIDTYELTIVV